MHPTQLLDCTPFAPQGDQKCTPPKSEMHPIYGTLLNLFIIPNNKREANASLLLLVHRKDGLEEGDRAKQCKKVYGVHFFSPGESPLTTDGNP